MNSALVYEKAIMEQAMQVLETVALLGPDAFEVEFVGTNGETYALLPLRAEQIMVLRYEQTSAV